MSARSGKVHTTFRGEATAAARVGASEASGASTRRETKALRWNVFMDVLLVGSPIDAGGVGPDEGRRLDGEARGVLAVLPVDGGDLEAQAVELREHVREIRGGLGLVGLAELG